MTNSSEKEHFWLALLTYPDDIQQRTRIWNGYLAWKLPGDFQREIRNVGNPPFNQYRQNENLRLSREEKRDLNALANKHGGHPTFLGASTGSPARLMDFSDLIFDDEACFAGRILIGASFCRTTFNYLADFRNVVFVNTAEFEQATFSKRTRFDSATFENTVYFKKVTFMETTVFDKSEFKVAAYFDGSNFLPVTGITGDSLGGVGFRQSVFAEEASFQETNWNVQTHFEGAKFQGEVNFRDSLFVERADFRRTTFDRVADFSCAEFRHETSFHDASFKFTTFFRDSIFLRPPKFFGTNLHEDTDFSGINWRRAESCYANSWWSKIVSGLSRDGTRSDVVDASSAIQAWDRLALVMSKLEKLPERHEFYRLRMRAQRKCDRWGILTLVNWLFDVLCEYGWSVRRALFWWLMHFIAAGLLIFGRLVPAGKASREALWDSLLVSFSNAHAFLGLTSDGGYLYEARQRLVVVVQDDSLLNTAGVIQTIIGPILLFLLLLTIRNRFRLR